MRRALRSFFVCWGLEWLERVRGREAEDGDVIGTEPKGPTGDVIPADMM